MNVTLGQFTGAQHTDTHISLKHIYKEYNVHAYRYRLKSSHMWSSSTICKCLDLLVALRGRPAEWQWAETGGATLCGNSDTVSVGHMLRYSNLILNLNFPPLGQVFTIFFLSCPTFFLSHALFYNICFHLLFSQCVPATHSWFVCARLVTSCVIQQSLFSCVQLVCFLSFLTAVICCFFLIVFTN